MRGKYHIHPLAIWLILAFGELSKDVIKTVSSRLISLIFLNVFACVGLVILGVYLYSS